MIDATGAVELARNAVVLMLMVSMPVLVVGMVVGVVVSVLQAVTQVQEQTLSFVPKIVVMLLTGVVMTPWAIAKLMEYSELMFGTLP